MQVGSHRASLRLPKSLGTVSHRPSQQLSQHYEGSPPLSRVGGRLQLFAEAWLDRIQDRWVLSTVSGGYKLELSEFPPPRFLTSNVPKDLGKRRSLALALDHLLSQGVIRELPVEEQGLGFYSNLFTVPKPNGDVRPILDLKALNKFLRVQSFRMESIRSVVASLQGGELLASIDIKDAYLHVPIFLDHQKLLRFAVNQRHFQFVALPFGLATAPRVFTKVLAPLLAYLRSQGISIVAYLDDLLVVDRSVADLNSAVHRTVKFLESMGWVLNLDKSALMPVQRLEYLGLLIDTKLKRVFLPQRKFEALRELVQLVKAKRQPPIRLCMRLLGKMVASFEAVPFAQFHSRELQHAILSAWNKKVQALDLPMSLSRSVRQSLCWWLVPRNLLKGKSFVPVTWQVVTTDASLLGWGAVLGGLSLQGKWSASERSLPINLLEIRAVYLALSAWSDRLKGLPVRIQSDNVTAVAYINHQGGTRSRAAQREVNRILTWAEKYVPCISAVFIPGIDNWRADYLSRQQVLPGEWTLHPDIFQSICQRWGTPDVDLFASRFNARVGNFLSRTRDPLAYGTDALVFPWDQFSLMYAFPPLQLLPRLLRRVKSEGRPVILVAPAWPRRAWFADIVRMSVGQPWSLPLRPDLLSQGPIFHPSLPSLNLTVWLLSPIS